MYCDNSLQMCFTVIHIVFAYLIAIVTCLLDSLAKSYDLSADSQIHMMTRCLAGNLSVTLHAGLIDL